MKLEPETVFQYGDQWFRIAEFEPVENAELIIKANRASAPAHGGEGAGDCEGGKLARQFADMYRSGAQGSEMDCDTARFLALSIDELASHSGEGAGVSEARVKRLEWDRESKPGVHFADTRIGTYSAYADGTLQLDGVQLSFVRGRQWSDTENAAQADFDKRIRSALTATQSAPAPGGWREALKLFASHLRGMSHVVQDGYVVHITKDDYERIVAPLSASPAPEPAADAVARRMVKDAGLHWTALTPAGQEGIANAETHGLGTQVFWLARAKSAIAALAQPGPAAQPVADAVVEATHVHAWIVGSGDGKRWRTWVSGSPEWTDDREKATRFSRREDAEAVHREDEDAWLVVPYKDLPNDADEAYEIGVRDGYEDAIQDLDLATGGDGEFRGSTFPGETVDVPAMRQRIVDRFAALAERQPQPQEGMPLVNAARELIAARQSTFKARNGRQVGIQDENGEKCWIVPFDEMFALENAVPAAAPLPSQKEGE